MYGWSAPVVAAMTPAQQMMYLGESDGHLKFNTLAEAKGWIDAHKS